MQNQGLIIGIDLGTTFSTVSFYNETTQRVELIAEGKDDVNIPSWISLDEYEKTGQIVVGKAAKTRGAGDLTIFDSKRMIGREYTEIDKDQMTQKWPFEVKNYEGPCIIYQNRDGENDRMYPEEVSGLILKYLVDLAKLKSGKSEIEKIIVTVPAEFKDKQKNSTLFACQLAFRGFGLKKNQVTLMNEPSAAILHYKKFREEKGMEPLKENAKVVVIDFGGGTLDIDCCICSKENITVVSNGGNQNLGGNDFDSVMMEMIKEAMLNEDDLIDENYFEEPTGRRVREQMIKQYKKRKTALRKEAERLKVLLSKRANVTVNLKNLLGNEYDEEKHDEFDISISRKAFEKKCEPLFKKFAASLRGVLNKRGGFNKQNVDAILLIGGSCLMPRIREEVGKLLNLETVINTEDFDPLTAVSMGATLSGLHSIQKANGIAAPDFYDTIPYPIGLEVNGGKFDEFCDEGEMLPIKREKVYSLQYPNQTSAEFNVYRGTSQFVNSPGMEQLGSFTLEGFPKLNRLLSVAVEIIIGNDGRVNINAKSEDLPKDPNEQEAEKKDEGEQNLEEVKGEEKRILEGGLELSMEFDKKTRHQEEIIAHFKTLYATRAQN